SPAGRATAVKGRERRSWWSRCRLQQVGGAQLGGERLGEASLDPDQRLRRAIVATAHARLVVDDHQVELREAGQLGVEIEGALAGSQVRARRRDVTVRPAVDRLELAAKQGAVK